MNAVPAAKWSSTESVYFHNIGTDFEEKNYRILLNVFQCFKKCINGATTLYLKLNSLHYIKNHILSL